MSDKKPCALELADALDGGKRRGIPIEKEFKKYFGWYSPFSEAADELRHLYVMNQLLLNMLNDSELPTDQYFQKIHAAISKAKGDK